jgi:hypothetical protein
VSGEDEYWTRSLARMDCNLESSKEDFDKTRRACKSLIEHAITSNHVTLSAELTALAAILKQQESNSKDLQAANDNANTTLHGHSILQPRDNGASTNPDPIPQPPILTSSTIISAGHHTTVSAAAISTQDDTLTEETIRAAKHQRPVSSDIEAHNKANRPDHFRQENLDELRRLS